ncbi:hypothetical protein [Geodermatophilus dictyosporus]|uniref:hypothetical protein n=1 Tax=Geodermatophilus dictyosporus TaxID=1523247 RepID=UPI0010AA38CA|nr:hypothetical protein [Geodermatophilus dictyosporus]
MDRASDVLTADLEPRPGGPVRHWVRVAGAFAAEMAQGLVPAPTVLDVVVRRRDDGTEVLRVPGEDPSAHLLSAVRDELAAVEPEEFLARWSVRTG